MDGVVTASKGPEPGASEFALDCEILRVEEV